MKEISVPPSPNWYLSQILDCSQSGRVAYGARDAIVLLNPENNTFSVIPGAHKDRVTSVQFAPAAAGNQLLSSGDDFVVRVWDLCTLQATQAHIVHTSSQDTAFASWSHADPDLVVSADAKGYVVVWNLKTNLTRSFHFKTAFTVVSCCPHKKNLVALGTKSGLVFIMDVSGKGKIVHKLRGHDVEVVSLSWCPSNQNIFKSDSTEETCLLASGGRDNYIYFWRAATDGRYERYVQLPPAPSADSGHRVQLGGASGQHGAWTCVCWPEPARLIASSPWGELLVHDVLSQTNESNQLAGRTANRKTKLKSWRLLHGKHGRGLFSIASGPCIKKEETTDSTDRTVWTVAQDRQIVSCSLSTGEILHSTTTFGQSVFCMAISPTDGSRLAVGVGDRTLRIWNLSDPNPDSMTLLWNKICGKVYSIAWHPTKEGWLAYGTSDGRIGLYDTMSNKTPIIFKMFFTHAVYVLEWGPPPPQPEVEEPKNETEAEVPETASAPAKTSRFFLYAVADGKVVAHDPAKPTGAPVNLKPFLSLLAIGNEDGSVHLVTPSREIGMRHVRTLLVQSCLIQDLSWHPPSCGDGLDSTLYASWLAVASNDSAIRVVDTTNLLASVADPTVNVSDLPVPVVATLKGHHQRVVHITWNPHASGQLLSTSYDESAVIWDVSSETALCHFSGHSGVVLCGLWNPLHSDYVLTGSGDSSLRMWKVSSQNEGAPAPKKQQSKAHLGAKQALPDKSFDTEAPENSREEKKQLLQMTGKSEEIARCEEDLRLDRKKLKHRSLFPISGPLMNEPSHLLDNLQDLLRTGEAKHSTSGDEPENAAVERTDEAAEKSVATAFFGDKEAVARLLETERAALMTSEQVEGAFTLGVWGCKIKEAVEEAITKQQLTDYIVSLSPMASIKIWQSACIAYAEQLRRSGDYIQSANYYLAVHHVEDAVNLLMDHGLFRQAVLIAKSRLLICDPFVKSVMEKWAKQKVQEGQLEVAANCWASIGEWIEASTVLSRRKDARAVSIAAQLAALGGSDEKAASLFLECLRISSKDDWEILGSSLGRVSEQKHVKLLFTVYKQVVNSLSLNFNPALWMKGTSEFGESTFEFDLSQNLPDSDGDVAEPEKEADGKAILSRQLYNQLLKLQSSCSLSSSRTDTLLSVTINVALAMACAPQCFVRLPEGFGRPKGGPTKSSVHEATCKLVQALAAVYDYHLREPTSSDMLIKLCILLSPKGPTYSSSIFAETTVSPAQKSSRAFLCAGVLSWLMTSSLLFPSQETEINLSRLSLEEEEEKDQDPKPKLRARRRLKPKTSEGANLIGSGPLNVSVGVPVASAHSLNSGIGTTARSSETDVDAKQDSKNQGECLLEKEQSDKCEMKEEVTEKEQSDKPEMKEEVPEKEQSDKLEIDEEVPEKEQSDKCEMKEEVTEKEQSDKPEMKEEVTEKEQSDKPEMKEEVTEKEQSDKPEMKEEVTEKEQSDKLEMDEEVTEKEQSDKCEMKEEVTEKEQSDKPEMKEVPEKEHSDKCETKEEVTGSDAGKVAAQSDSASANSERSSSAAQSMDQRCASLENETIPSLAISKEFAQDNSLAGNEQNHHPSRDGDTASEKNDQKEALILALDLIKSCSRDLFSSSNMKYFTASVRIKVLLHSEASAAIKENTELSKRNLEVRKENVEVSAPITDKSTDQVTELAAGGAQPNGGTETEEKSERGEENAAEPVGRQETDEKCERVENAAVAELSVGNAQPNGGAETEEKSERGEENPSEPVERQETDEKCERVENAAVAVLSAGNAQPNGGAETKENAAEPIGRQETDEKCDCVEEISAEPIKPALTERQLVIKNLRDWFTQFEGDQVKVPNPFVCYSNLITALNRTSAKIDATQTEAYVQYFKVLWDEAKAANS